jgi:hypothetical protein
MIRSMPNGGSDADATRSDGMLHPIEEMTMTLRKTLAGLVLAAGLALPVFPASAALMPVKGPVVDLTEHPARAMTETAQYWERRGYDNRRYNNRRYNDRGWGPPRPAYRSRTVCRYEPRRVFNPRNGRWVVRQVEVCSRRR